jgi:hypothetical protein
MGLAQIEFTLYPGPRLIIEFAAAIESVDLLPLGINHQTLMANQEAMIAHLRHPAHDGRPLLLLTRSNAILDLDAVDVSRRNIVCILKAASLN